MDAYQHCWDPALLIRAGELWARYKEGFLPGGDHIIGSFNVSRPLELYARCTRDPEALELLTVPAAGLSLARSWASRRNCAGA